MARRILIGIGSLVLFGWHLVQARASDNPEPEVRGIPPLKILPDFSRVPANHLKYYLHFAVPMERGDVFQYLRLVEIDQHDREIAEVPEPFREVELWDSSFRRLTLWFHPGRQKPGVNLNVEMGPILEEGKRYRLEISKDWKSETGGQPFPDGFQHSFSAGPIDETSPRPGRWAIEKITRKSLLIRFGESLDPVSVSNRISVRTGKTDLSSHLQGWEIDEAATLEFSSPLESGEYQLVIDPRLEDLAGNSIARPFNLDLEKHPDFEEKTEPVILPFTVPATP